MTDTIAEMLTTIRNAQMAGHTEAWIKFSKLKLAMAKILEKEGFVENAAEEKDENNFKKIKIALKYYKVSDTKKVPAIKDIQRVSKEGRRVYIKSKDIRKVRDGFGLAIVSTSRGLMTGEESRKAGLGGEYICKLW
jgi:small subunit ribosomal protein S8